MADTPWDDERVLRMVVAPETARNHGTPAVARS
jgi:hypothetical protein